MEKFKVIIVEDVKLELKGTEEARREHDARVEAIAAQIVEEGTHEQLLAIPNGSYASLYNAQFKKKHD